MLANDDSPVKVDVSIAFHPSFLVEADLKNINSIPVAIFAGMEDDMLSVDQLNQVSSYEISRGISWADGSLNKISRLD